jgi:hypothetical protein
MPIERGFGSDVLIALPQAWSSIGLPPQTVLKNDLVALEAPKRFVNVSQKSDLDPLFETQGELVVHKPSRDYQGMSLPTTTKPVGSVTRLKGKLIW